MPILHRLIQSRLHTCRSSTLSSTEERGVLKTATTGQNLVKAGIASPSMTTCTKHTGRQCPAETDQRSSAGQNFS